MIEHVFDCLQAAFCNWGKWNRHRRSIIDVWTQHRHECGNIGLLWKRRSRWKTFLGIVFFKFFCRKQMQRGQQVLIAWKMLQTIQRCCECATWINDVLHVSVNVGFVVSKNCRSSGSTTKIVFVMLTSDREKSAECDFVSCLICCTIIRIKWNPVSFHGFRAA